jgi:hypothetical protein
MARRLAAIPYPPGQSPYCIKGIGYRAHLEYTNAHVPGGVDRALSVLGDAEVSAFYAQPFMAASWYDIFPMVELGMVSAELAGLPYREYLVQRTLRQVHADLRGVYHQFLLFIASPGSVAARLPGAMSRYFNFAPARITEEGPGSSRGMCGPMPRALLPWYEPVATTWLVEALRMARTAEPRIDLTTRPAPVANKLEQLEVHWHLSWDR